MKTEYFVWHGEFQTHIKITRSEYSRLKSEAKSKDIGYEQNVFACPDFTHKYLSFVPLGRSRSARVRHRLIGQEAST